MYLTSNKNSCPLKANSVFRIIIVMALTVEQGIIGPLQRNERYYKIQNIIDHSLYKVYQRLVHYQSNAKLKYDETEIGSVEFHQFNFIYESHSAKTVNLSRIPSYS